MPQDSDRHHIKLSLESDSLAVRDTLACVRERLQALSFSDANCSIVELVLAEVLNNVVEHAYGDGGRGKIHLRVDVQAGNLSLKVVDYGKPMPHYSLPIVSPSHLNYGRENLPEGGWGWLIIHEAAEDLNYVRRGSENHLEFRLTSNRAF